MKSLTLVLGGARSGKSNYAQKLAMNLNKKTLFLATALPFDQDMKDRIEKHRQSRPKNWETIETYRNFKGLSDNNLFNSSEVVLLDCLTLFVSNQMLEAGVEWEHTTPENLSSVESGIKLEMENLFEISSNKDLILVSNEVGMGVVPDNYLANYFRDIMGRINQMVAARANRVVFMVAGIPIIIKGEES